MVMKMFRGLFGKKPAQEAPKTPTADEQRAARATAEAAERRKQDIDDQLRDLTARRDALVKEKNVRGVLRMQRLVNERKRQIYGSTVGEKEKSEEQEMKELVSSTLDLFLKDSVVISVSGSTMFVQVSVVFRDPKTGRTQPWTLGGAKSVEDAVQGVLEQEEKFLRGES